MRVQTEERVSLVLNRICVVKKQLPRKYSAMPEKNELVFISRCRRLSTNPRVSALRLWFGREHFRDGRMDNGRKRLQNEAQIADIKTHLCIVFTPRIPTPKAGSCHCVCEYGDTSAAGLWSLFQSCCLLLAVRSQPFTGVQLMSFYEP